MLKRNTSRYKKDAHPVTDVTLILVGLSRSAKTGVANQIQHHLTGCQENNPEPIPEDSCHKLEGKVLGLKVMSVNTPDVEEDEESNKGLGNKVKKYATGDYAIVMVIAAGSEEDRGIEMERLLRFNTMAFGKKANGYTIAMVTSKNSQANIDDAADDDSIVKMSFDIDANMDSNNIQVQVLFNNAKMLVKRGQEQTKLSKLIEDKAPNANDREKADNNTTDNKGSKDTSRSTKASEENKGPNGGIEPKKKPRKGSYKKMK